MELASGAQTLGGGSGLDEDSDDDEPKAQTMGASSGVGKPKVERPMLCWRAPLDKIRSPFEMVGENYANTLETDRPLMDRLYPASEALTVANAAQGGHASLLQGFDRDAARRERAAYQKQARTVLEVKLREARAELGMGVQH